MQCNAEAEHWIDFTFVTYIVDGIHIECRYRNTNKCQYKSQNERCIRPNACHITFLAAHGVCFVDVCTAFKRFFRIFFYCSQIFVFIKSLTFIRLSVWISQTTNLILKLNRTVSLFFAEMIVVLFFFSVVGKGLQGTLNYPHCLAHFYANFWKSFFFFRLIHLPINCCSLQIEWLASDSWIRI